MNIRRIAVLVVVLCAAVVPAKAWGQLTNDVIRGRVTGPDTLPLKDVLVKATSYQGQVTKTANTDKNGRYTIIFVNGEGDYWLDFTKIGFTPKRYEIKKVDQEEILIGDAKLGSAIAQLDAVNITAQNRALVNRNSNTGDVGGGDKSLPVNSAQLPPDQAGNLAALASTIPGIQLIPGMDGAADMFSALGLGGDQNSTTFNGLGSGINMLPPDAVVGVRFNSFPWQVSAGGFSGAQISLFSQPGSNYSYRLMSGYGTGPDLQWTDENADSTGLKSTTLRFGGNARGPIRMDKAFYNSSYSGQRTFSDLLTLLNTSPIGLNAVGVSADSVARMLSILRGKGVPVSVARTPSFRATDQATLQTNVDLVPSTSGTGNAFTLGLNAVYVHAQPIGGGSLITTTPARTGESEFYVTQASLNHSNYFWFGVLSQTTLGYSLSHQIQFPFLNYPNGVVRVASDLPDGSSAIRSLSFGGGNQPFTAVNQVVALNNTLRWYSENNKHAITMTEGVTREHNTQDISPSPGSFSFNSLSDLENGIPSSYSRVLSSIHTPSDQLTLGGSIGDAWRPITGSADVQVTYGVRVDGNRFLTTPTLNPAIRDTFGLNNDHVPNRVYVTPRVGVQWTYGKAPTIAYIPGAARPPRAVIHAGAGFFQNLSGATRTAQAVSQTGLPSSTQSILCVGPAAPFPDWSAFLVDQAAVPTACADGSAGTVFSNTAPSVALFDPGYRQERSFRTEADWSSGVWDNRFVLGFQGIYSWNMNQQGLVDLNFSPAQRFALANEGGRPVYADPTAIVPTTGAVAVSNTRVSQAFRSVTELRSDLHSASHQYGVQIQPVTSNKYLKWTFNYTLLDVRDEFYGFSNTVGNPFDKAWGPHTASGRHQFTLSWNSLPIFDLISVYASVSVKSGQRFTPIVLGDVNGDGFAGNDRAFVFDPSKTADSALAANMNSLLKTGASEAKSCLARQLNQLAARASCNAPWVVTIPSLTFRFNPQKIGLPKRADVTVSLTNPLAVADLVLHGDKNTRGWGQEIPPDQVLLSVRGFDPVNDQFKYQVNDRFGSTRPQQTASRAAGLLSVNVRYDIGYTRERQLLTQRLDMGRGRPGTKQPASTMKSLAVSSIPNPMAMVLQQPDSLKLTRKQADSLASLSRKFTLHADSLWTPVSKSFEGLPDRYDHGDAYDAYVRAREQTIDYLIKVAPDVRSLLTASQKRKLPCLIVNYLDDRVLKFLRSSSAGDGSALYFGC